MWGRFKRALEDVLAAGRWLPTIDRTASPDAIAITLDDGPSPATTPRILELLQTYRATATFFLCGARAAAYPDLVEAIVARGHPIYTQGFNHVRMDGLSPKGFFANLDEAEALLGLFRVTPSPYFVRLPYGAGHRDLRVHRMLRSWREDCVLTDWRYSLDDFRIAEGCATEAELRVRCAEAADEAFSRSWFRGSIIVMHEKSLVEAPHSASVAPILLEEILGRARQTGLAVVELNAPRSLAARPVLRGIAAN